MSPAVQLIMHICCQNCSGQNISRGIHKYRKKKKKNTSKNVVATSAIKHGQIIDETVSQFFEIKFR